MPEVLALYPLSGTEELCGIEAVAEELLIGEIGVGHDAGDIVQRGEGEQRVFGEFR